MKRILFLIIVVLNVNPALAEECTYALTQAGAETGNAIATINTEKVRIKVTDAVPDSLYTVWVDFKSRTTGQLAADYPLSKGALARGVAPAFASTAGVTAGIGIDPNGLVTDSEGDAHFKVKLDYALLIPGVSPVVGAELALQGLNRVDGYWLRQYPVDPSVAASSQITDPATRLPVLERATAQGFTIVRHPNDKITHGHTPGVKGVDHVSGFKGDFPLECL